MAVWPFVSLSDRGLFGSGLLKLLSQDLLFELGNEEAFITLTVGRFNRQE